MGAGFAATMLIGLCLDAALGWPQAIHRRIGHPVTWAGRLIAGLDTALNRETSGGRTRRAAGALTAALVLAACTLPAILVQQALPATWWGVILGGGLAWPLFALRSMHDHVRDVERPLASGDRDGARHAVSMIVGRDPAALDAGGIRRAALESLAENTSDAIVAPLCWGLVLGLPGLAAYKAVNTMDSMIGHRSARHEDFGKAAARLDDLVNLIPARLTGLLFALASSRPRAALACMARDARLHRSPNAGWPEAALAGGLGLRLSGPRSYGARMSQEPWVNGGAPDPGPDALPRGLALYRRTMALTAFLVAVLAFAQAPLAG